MKKEFLFDFYENHIENIIVDIKNGLIEKHINKLILTMLGLIFLSVILNYIILIMEIVLGAFILIKVYYILKEKDIIN